MSSAKKQVELILDELKIAKRVLEKQSKKCGWSHVGVIFSISKSIMLLEGLGVLLCRDTEEKT